MGRPSYRLFAVGLTITSAIWIASTTRTARAQPEPEIEMGEEGSGSGSGSGSAAPAIPSPPKKDPRAAKKAFAAGQANVAKAESAVKRGKAEDAKAAYEAALASYVTATDLGDDINYYFYLAGVEDKLGKFVEAVKHYRLVLRAQSGVQAAVGKQISAKLEEAMGKVGTVQITVSPDGAEITLANEVVGVAPLAEPLVLLPGTYTFSFNAPGYQVKDSEIKVEAGSESERKIELESISITIEKPKKPIETEPEETPKNTKPTMIPVFVGAGVAGGLLITSIITGVLAGNQHDTFVAAETTPAGRNDAREVGKDYAHLTDVCLVGTVLAGGFAAYWYVFQVRPKLKAQAEAVSKVSVAPWVQRETSGIAVFGRF